MDLLITDHLFRQRGEVIYDNNSAGSVVHQSRDRTSADHETGGSLADDVWLLRWGDGSTVWRGRVL